jgi:hypothetical protein
MVVNNNKMINHAIALRVLHSFSWLAFSRTKKIVLDSRMSAISDRTNDTLAMFSFGGPLRKIHADSVFLIGMIRDMSGDIRCVARHPPTSRRSLNEDH